jgi:hypothetical protein
LLHSVASLDTLKGLKTEGVVPEEMASQLVSEITIMIYSLCHIIGEIKGGGGKGEGKERGGER